MARTWLNPHPSSEVRPQDQWWARDPVEVDGAGGCVCLGGSQRGGDALRDAQVILSAPSCGLTFTLAQKYLHFRHLLISSCVASGCLGSCRFQPAIHHQRRWWFESCVVELR